MIVLKEDEGEARWVLLLTMLAAHRGDSFPGVGRQRLLVLSSSYHWWVKRAFSGPWTLDEATFCWHFSLRFWTHLLDHPVNGPPSVLGVCQVAAGSPEGGLVPGQKESGGNSTPCSAPVVPLQLTRMDTWPDLSTQDRMEKINVSEPPFRHT